MGHSHSRHINLWTYFFMKALWEDRRRTQNHPSLLIFGKTTIRPISLSSLSMKIKKFQENREKLRIYHYTMEENATSEERVESEVKEGEVVQEEFGIIEEVGVKLMLRRINFWLYFSVYFFGATVGLVYLNNLGQIAESRGCSNISSLVSLSSSFGFFGRLMPSLMYYFYR